MVERVRPTELVHAARDLGEVLRDGVEERHLVEQPVRTAFGARAVVTLDVDHQRVVELALFAHRVEDATHLVVGVRKCRGVDLHHAGSDLLVLGVERVPRRDARRTLGQLGSLRHDAEFDLPRQGLLAHLVPALVELALEAIDPLLRRVVRRVRRAGRVVGDERLLRRNGMLHLQPGDRVVRHVAIEEVVLAAVRRLDRLGALGDRRRPLTRVAADEAIEVLEAETRGPQIERSRLAALPVRDVVVLAVPRGVEAVLLQDLGEGPARLRHQRVVAREAGAGLHDDAGGAGVVVATREQRRARRRAQGRGVELRVAQPLAREPVHRRGRDRPAERAGRAEADVVGQEHQDVRGSLRRSHSDGEVLHGVSGGAPLLALERRLGPRQNGARVVRRRAAGGDDRSDREYRMRMFGHGANGGWREAAGVRSRPGGSF